MRARRPHCQGTATRPLRFRDIRLRLNSRVNWGLPGVRRPTKNLKALLAYAESVVNDLRCGWSRARVAISRRPGTGLRRRAPMRLMLTRGAHLMPARVARPAPPQRRVRHAGSRRTSCAGSRRVRHAGSRRTSCAGSRRVCHAGSRRTSCAGSRRVRYAGSRRTSCAGPCRVRYAGSRRRPCARPRRALVTPARLAFVIPARLARLVPARPARLCGPASRRPEHPES
jgi:hypothetical protein